MTTVDQSVKHPTLPRKTHTLPPQRWRAIIILTDTPGPGEAHLTADEIKEAFERAVDLPAGLEFEFGTIEHAAKTPGQA